MASSSDSDIIVITTSSSESEEENEGTAGADTGTQHMESVAAPAEAAGCVEAGKPEKSAAAAAAMAWDIAPPNRSARSEDEAERVGEDEVAVEAEGDAAVEAEGDADGDAEGDADGDAERGDAERGGDACNPAVAPLSDAALTDAAGPSGTGAERGRAGLGGADGGRSPQGGASGSDSPSASEDHAGTVTIEPNGVLRFDPAQGDPWLVRPRTFVRVRADDESPIMWLAQVRKVFNNEDDEVMVAIHWLYSPLDAMEEVKPAFHDLLRRMQPGQDYLYSFHQDEIQAGAIEGPVDVLFRCAGEFVPPAWNGPVVKHVLDSEDKEVASLGNKDFIQGLLDHRQKNISSLLRMGEKLTQQLRDGKYVPNAAAKLETAADLARKRAERGRGAHATGGDISGKSKALASTTGEGTRKVANVIAAPVKRRRLTAQQAPEEKTQRLREKLALDEPPPVRAVPAARRQLPILT